MKKYPALWWRIVGGCLLGVIVITKLTILAAYLLSAPPHLVKLPLHTAITFEVEPLDGKESSPKRAWQTAHLLGQRLGLDIVPTANNHIKVRIPVTDSRSKLSVRDIDRLVRRYGILEFRILVEGDPSTDEHLANEIIRLKDYGPQLEQRASKVDTGGEYGWFELRDPSTRSVFPPHTITAECPLDNKTYVLAYLTPEKTLLAKPNAESGKRWGLKKVSVGHDSHGKPSVDFEFDDTGSEMFETLTRNNRGKLLAVLVDNVVYSAPMIRNIIRYKGQINGNFTYEEVYELTNILQSGTMPLDANLNLLSFKYAVAGEKPPHATLKYSLLIGVAVIMVLALAISLWAIIAARLSSCGVFSFLFAVSFVGWWAIVVWNNYTAKHMLFAASIPSMILVGGTMIIWIIAACTSGHKNISTPAS